MSENLEELRKQYTKLGEEIDRLEHKPGDRKVNGVKVEIVTRAGHLYAAISTDTSREPEYLNMSLPELISHLERCYEYIKGK